MSLETAKKPDSRLLDERRSRAPLDAKAQTEIPVVEGLGTSARAPLTGQPGMKRRDGNVASCIRHMVCARGIGAPCVRYYLAELVSFGAFVLRGAGRAARYEMQRDGPATSGDASALRVADSSVVIP